jgi:hypothetical protein
MATAMKTRHPKGLLRRPAAGVIAVPLKIHTDEFLATDVSRGVINYQELYGVGTMWTW